MSERELRKDIDKLRIIIDKTLDMEIRTNKCIVNMTDRILALEERIKKLEDAGQSITDSGDENNGYSDKVEKKGRTFYGTTIKDGDNTCINLNGYDLLVPCLQEEVPKMGEWMKTTVCCIDVFRCNLCGAFSDARYPYCQWCGSKMKNNNLVDLFEEK